LWRGSHGLYAEGIVARLYLGAALIGALLLLLTWCVRANSGPSGKTVKLVLWLVFLVTPFFGAYGSTTSVYLNGALYAICWTSALLLVALEIAHAWDAAIVLRFTTIPIAMYAAAQLFHGQVVLPYMSTVPLWQENTPTQIGPNGSVVQVNAAASACINETRRILTEHGFNSGDDIFCFFNVPGLVYAVGGVSPVIPWYFGRIYVGNPVEEIHMQAAGEDRRRKAFIITQADVLQFRDHFHRGGFNFPENYEEIGSLKNPQSGLPLRIWKPRTTR
jgi:hypothetical protein